MISKSPLIVILGPTAVGKTKIATHLASRIDGEIISADSRQVYRHLDIGTGKDLSDYCVDNKPIPYHVINCCSPNDEYNLPRFQQDFTTAFHDISSRSKQAILCGGTGLYIQAVLENYRITSIPNNALLRKEFTSYSKEQLQDTILSYTFPSDFKADISSTKRLIRAIEIGEFLKINSMQNKENHDYNVHIFGLNVERELRRQWITERLKNRLDNGLIEEVEELIKSGISKDRLRYFGLEYKYITDYLDGSFDRRTLFNKLNIAIHQFAKRQMTWFRKMERQGHEINWIDAKLPLDEKVREIVDKYQH